MEDNRLSQLSAEFENILKEFVCQEIAKMSDEEIKRIKDDYENK